MRVVVLKIHCLVGVSVLSPGDAHLYGDDKAAEMVRRGHGEYTEDPVLVEQATSRHRFYQLNG